MTKTFPKDFIWGVSTAGHQIEGDNTTSDTWFAENVTPSVFKERSGKACDSFVRWEEDLNIVKSMNLSAFRFSIEWARIEPTEGTYDPAALEHYRAIIDGCHARGLKAAVTLNHFTAPHWFAAKGGWFAEDAITKFEAYVEHLIRNLGDGIDYAVTLNEPNLARLLSFAGLPQFVRDLERATIEAATIAAGVERYRLANVVLQEEIVALEDRLALAHVAARKVVKSIKPNLPIGLSIAITDDQVVGHDSSFRDRKRVECYERWFQIAKDDDFIGVQNYERIYYNGEGQCGADGGEAPHGLFNNTDARSLVECVRYSHSETGVPVLVTEHGMSTEDDAKRLDFVEAALGHLADATKDVPVIGYLHWTLMDNFEWIFGYGPKLGLYSVDRETFERTPKGTAQLLATIAKNGAV